MRPRLIGMGLSSLKCDDVEGEVVDLLISIHREFKGTVTAISGERECGGRTRKYVLSGQDFAKYRSGKMNDAAVLKGLQ